MRELTARTLAFALVGAIVLLPATASADSAFDADTGLVRLPTDALRTWGFETGDAAVLELASWDVSGTTFAGAKTRAPLTADVIAERQTSAYGDAVEGKHAIRLGDANAGLAITEPALWQSVAASRFEVVLWIRADGTEPDIEVVYDQDADVIFHGWNSTATIRAIRTGRETSDGWIEMSTGPIDGSVRGVPVRAVAIMPDLSSPPSATFLVDALEIRPAPGTPTPDVACMQSNVETICGATGDCQFGHCVPESIVWGALPPAAHRHELVERWVHWATHVMGDRKAVDAAFATFTPAARALADEATSSRRFFGGMALLVNGLRDSHTSFGFPLTFTGFTPTLSPTSSPLGACFGVVDRDLLGGGRGYAVFRARDKPISGIPLQVGDVLASIDGEDPDRWLDENWMRFAPSVANDPDADPSSRALYLSALLAQRASKVTLLRCASATACDAGHRTTITLDVAAALGAVALQGTRLHDPHAFSCSTRFQDAIAGIPTTDTDTVTSAVGPTGATLVQFDGFHADTAWDDAMVGAFAGAPATVVLDARMGFGGYLSHVRTLLDQVRSTSDPLGVVSLERLTYERTDPTPEYASCVASGVDAKDCIGGTGEWYFPETASPPGENSKIAWLQSFDVSANDYAARLLQGRKKVMLFGPHPTDGAFGAREDLPPLVTGWYGGSLQSADSHFATSPGGIASSRWESGHGVVPDVFVAQKLSDALAGVDTILTTATTWLEAP